jgi:hypothetical protein
MAVKPPERQRTVASQDVFPKPVQRPKAANVAKVADKPLQQLHVAVKGAALEQKKIIPNPTWVDKLSLFCKKLFGYITKTQYEMQYRMWGLQEASQLKEAPKKEAKVLENLREAKNYVQSDEFVKSTKQERQNYINTILDQLPADQPLQGDAALLKAFFQLEDVRLNPWQEQQESDKNVLAALKGLNVFSKVKGRDQNLVDDLHTQLNDLSDATAISFDSKTIPNAVETMNKGWSSPEFGKKNFNEKKAYLQEMWHGIDPYTDVLTEGQKLQKRNLDSVLKAFDLMDSKKTQDTLKKTKAAFEKKAALEKSYEEIRSLGKDIYESATPEDHYVRAAFAEKLYQSLGRECYCDFMKHVMRKEASLQVPDEKYFRESTLFSLLYGYFVQKEVLKEYKKDKFSANAENNFINLSNFVKENSRSPEIEALQAINKAFQDVTDTRIQETKSTKDSFQLLFSNFLLIGVSPKILDMFWDEKQGKAEEIGTTIRKDIQKAATLQAPKNKEKDLRPTLEILGGHLGFVKTAKAKKS